MKLEKKDIPRLLKLFFKLEHKIQETITSFMNIKGRTISADRVENFLSDITNLTNKQIYLADSKYNVPTLNGWKKIIQYDLSDEKEYVSEMRDCDQFADYFSARCAFLYLINSSVNVSGELLDRDTKEHIGYHRYNYLLTLDKDENLKAYLYEPMSDEITEIEKGKHPSLGDWTYKALYSTAN